MKEFKVRIKETLVMDVCIETENEQEAIDKVRANWKKSEYILEAENFSGVEFDIVNSEV